MLLSEIVKPRSASQKTSPAFDGRSSENLLPFSLEEREATLQTGTDVDDAKQGYV